MTHIRITSAADLAASVPTLLGFYPKNAIVFCGTASNESCLAHIQLSDFVEFPTDAIAFTASKFDTPPAALISTTTTMHDITDVINRAQLVTNFIAWTVDDKAIDVSNGTINYDEWKPVVPTPDVLEETINGRAPFESREAVVESVRAVAPEAVAPAPGDLVSGAFAWVRLLNGSRDLKVVAAGLGFIEDLTQRDIVEAWLLPQVAQIAQLPESTDVLGEMVGSHNFTLQDVFEMLLDVLRLTQVQHREQVARMAAMAGFIAGDCIRASTCVEIILQQKPNDAMAKALGEALRRGIRLPLTASEQSNG